MAVFVGSGNDGWGKVVQDGLDASVNRLLAQKVCLRLHRPRYGCWEGPAHQFQVASRGLIISDRAGTAQAYSPSGSMTRSELVQTLEKYADKDIKVTETIVREAPDSRAAGPIHHSNREYSEDLDCDR